MRLRLKRIFGYSVAVALLAVTAFGCGQTENMNEGSSGTMTTDSFVHGRYRLELSYPSEPLAYGDTVQIELSIEYPEGSRYILMPPNPDSSGRFSNTVITDIEEKKPVYNAEGRAVSRIIFSLEAWLPGELIFPPLTVVFDEEIKTDEVVLEVLSAFDDGTDQHELAPIYVPGTERSSAPIIILSSAGALIAAAAVFLLFLIRKKRRKMNTGIKIKSRGELINDFRNKYLESDRTVNLKEAFTEADRLIDTELPPQYRRRIDTARFSRDGIPYSEGIETLKDLYESFLAGGRDEL